MKMSRSIIATICSPALACCSANSNLPNLNIPSIDLFDPPATATVAIKSNPPGAEARASSGGLCRTPCALAVPANEGFTVTYVLDGYLPQTVSVRSIPAEKSALIDMTPPNSNPIRSWPNSSRRLHRRRTPHPSKGGSARSRGRLPR